MINEDFQAELIWKEKYDKIEVGEKKTIEKTPLPFQKVETINKPRDKQQPLFSSEEDKNWINKIIWGDNKYILASLINGDPSIDLESLKGKIKLIYIDPPFFTGSNMPIKIKVPNGEDLTKEPSITEEVAYRNIWKDGLNSFCQWFYERALMMKELLAEEGSIFVRFDYHYSHYIKLILDEIFGRENFRNEITINRTLQGALNTQFDTMTSMNVAFDSLFWYSKNTEIRFKPVMKKTSEERAKSYWHGFWKPSDRPTMRYKLFGIKPSKGQWLWKEERTLKAMKNYELFIKESKNTGGSLEDYWKKTGKTSEFIAKIGKSDTVNSVKYWIPPREFVMANTNWTDIPGYSFSTGYPTENAEPLLKRVIDFASNKGEIVADFFGGSGTTAAVAEKLGRKWITADIGKFSIHTMRKRILDIDVKKDKIIRKPFEILNLGKYERQRWQLDNLGKDQLAYIKFIVELYHSTFVEGFGLLHGKIGDIMVHVGAIDSPITWKEIKDCLDECKVYKIKKMDILGWEFENGLHSLIEDEAKKNGVKLRLKYIPREVMDKRATDSGNIKFFELAYLDVDVKQKKDLVKIKLKDFLIPNPEFVPEESKEKIKNFTDYIDYWAVDWNFREDTFHNEWQTFRTKKDKKIDIESEEHTYSKKGNYKIMVKVVDIFGNDTTKLLEMKIK